MQATTIEAGEKVVSRDGMLCGSTTGSAHKCRMEGCNGRRIGVRWTDGVLTFPCTKGMDYDDNEWKII